MVAFNGFVAWRATERMRGEEQIIGHRSRMIPSVIF